MKHFGKVNVKYIEVNRFQIKNLVDVVITETNGMVACSITSSTMFLTTYLTKEIELNKMIADIEEVLNKAEKNEDIISDYLGVFSV